MYLEMNIYYELGKGSQAMNCSTKKFPSAVQSTYSEHPKIGQVRLSNGQF
jgi:hypothetical protein